MLKKAKPEELSVSSDAIIRTIAAIREVSGQELHSFLVARNGALLWEEYFREGEAERLHVLHSVSKSFTSLAIGIASAEGLINIDDKIFDYFPEYENLREGDYKHEVTLRHFLMMSSGFENKEMEVLTDPFCYEVAKRALSSRAIHSPGTVFCYYTLGTYLLSAAFSKVCPMGIHEFLRAKLFAPMGIERTHWNVDNTGIPLGGYGLYMRARDLLYVGQMLLQRGKWGSQQLVPAEYIAEATSKHIDQAGPTPLCADTDWNAGYGFQFWQNSFGGYRADGMHGQYAIVLPEKDLVVVMTSRAENMQSLLTAVAERLLAGVGD